MGPTRNQAIEECRLAGPRDRGGLQLCDGHSLTRTAWPAEPRCAKVFNPFFSTCGKALFKTMGQNPKQFNGTTVPQCHACHMPECHATTGPPAYGKFVVVFIVRV